MSIFIRYVLFILFAFLLAIESLCGQNVAGRPGAPDLTEKATMAEYLSSYKDKLKGEHIRAPPGNYMIKGDTIYIQAINQRNRQEFYIMEFIAKPHDKNLIEMLLNAEIKSGDDKYEMFFRAAENWDGNTIKADYIQIGNYNPAYIFEAANKKDK